ncbi:MAG: pentapeptide repeat-containing protein [Candidatus Binatia bacterium]
MKDPHLEYAEKLLGSVNDAAGAVSSRFVTFVSVGAYIAVTIAATSHEMLLRATNLVTLPLLNAQIPIIGAFGFYTIAPWLIVLLHSDLLLQLSILATELERFDGELQQAPERERPFLRQRLANFYYVLYFTGQAPSRLLHLLAAFITWVTAVAIPLGLLLWIQVRFLPYHSPVDTWFHRAAVVADVVLILFILLPRITPLLKVKEGASGWLTTLRRAFSVPSLVVAGCTLSVAFSLLVATIPDDDYAGDSWFPRNMELRERVLTSNTLSPEDINTLRDDGDLARLRPVLAKIIPYQALQGRDFRYADMYNAVFPKIDLRAAPGEGPPPEPPPADCADRRACQDPPECDPAGNRRTRLSGAIFDWASMQQAMFDDAILEGSGFSWAKVQDASFHGVRANSAVFASARLQGARFDNAKLCGADFGEANLAGASLARTFLQGANLRRANLSRANLDGADLRGADLSSADLTDANLRGALLQGATLRGAVTRGANFEGATFEHTELAKPADASPSAALSAPDPYLVALACADSSAALGIARQAAHSPAREGSELARALLEATADPQCVGLGSLPAATREALQARAASR